MRKLTKMQVAREVIALLKQWDFGWKRDKTAQYKAMRREIYQTTLRCYCL